MKSKTLGLIGLSAVLTGPLWPQPARADDAPFGYIYTTDTLPKGQWEYEQWNTVRTGRVQGSYTAFDLRNEIEHGFTDQFTASLYLNSAYHHVVGVPEAGDPVENLEQQNSFDISGVSMELKYRLLSPYKDPLGLMIYLEPELGVIDPAEGVTSVERALEGKVIVQKNFFEDRLVTAANFSAEPEWEIESGERSKALSLQFTSGVSYQVATGWFTGLELRYDRKYDNFDTLGPEALFLGPNIHYANKAWWTTFTVLPQIAGSPRRLGFDENGNPVEDSSRELNKHEKMEFRLRFGFTFG